MHPNGMQAGIGDHLPNTASGWITLENGSYIFSNAAIHPVDIGIFNRLIHFRGFSGRLNPIAFGNDLFSMFWLSALTSLLSLA